MKIAILGSTGMLGNTVLKFFCLYAKNINLIIPKRLDFKKKLEFVNSLECADYVINCSGAIPQRMPNYKTENDKQNY